MIPERYGPATHALMRMAFALILLNYGLQKFGLFGGIDGHGGTAPFLSWPCRLSVRGPPAPPWCPIPIPDWN